MIITHHTTYSLEHSDLALAKDSQSSMIDVLNEATGMIIAHIPNDTAAHELAEALVTAASDYEPPDSPQEAQKKVLTRIYDALERLKGQAVHDHKLKYDESNAYNQGYLNARCTALNDVFVELQRISEDVGVSPR